MMRFCQFSVISTAHQWKVEPASHPRQSRKLQNSVLHLSKDPQPSSPPSGKKKNPRFLSLKRLTLGRHLISA